MQSAQESKQELEAAIRYAENAISSAKTTIESMEFRQEMAKKQRSEQTGREESLTKLVKELEEANEKLAVDNSNLERKVDKLRNELHGLLVYRDLEEARGRAEGEVELLQRTISELEAEVQRQQDLGQGYYDSMMTFKTEVEKLRGEKEASSGPCGCQAYRDLEEFNAELSKQNVSLAEGKPTMPVIPKAVAIAIFREGMAYGACRVCDEIENASEICIEENEYCGGFEVSFTKDVDLSDELDLDYLRESTSVYDESSVIDALYTLCADNKFECRIHGVDDQEEKKND